MGMKTKQGAVIADINMVPFIDIVLVVLIIFLVTAPSFVKPVLDVKLPKATAGKEEPSKPAKVVLGITGQLAFNGEVVSEKVFTEKLKALLTQNPEVPVILSADKDVVHGKVVSMIDLLKKNGVKKFAVSVEPSDN